MVADGYLRTEPAGNHLPPRSPGLIVLVDNGRVATEIDGRYVDSFNMNALHGGHRTVELQRQLVVPGQVVVLTRLNLYTGLLVNLW